MDYTYDLVGNRRESVTDDRGFTTSFEYDALGRIIKTVHPNSVVAEAGPNAVHTYTHVGYDCFGRKSWESNPVIEELADYVDANEICYFNYDAAGRLTGTDLPAIVDPCSQQWTRPYYDFQCDVYGNMIEIRDPIEYRDQLGNRVTKFTHNELHKQTSRTLPGGKTEYKDYDEFGRVIKATDFAGHVTEFIYNNRGLLEYRKLYDNNDLYNTYEPNVVYEFAYDNLGRKINVDINDLDAGTVETYSYYYDVEGRVIQIDSPQGVIAYEYSPITGRMLFVLTPADGSDTKIEYTYDALGRLYKVIVHRRNGVAVNKVAIYTYNEVGSLKSVEYPNGNYPEYTYDALNRLVNLTNYQDSTKAVILSSFDYTLCADGIRKSVTESDGTLIDWSYDNLNRLEAEEYDAPGTSDDYVHDYYYDIVGNRIQFDIDNTPDTYYFHNDNDQLIRSVTGDVNTFYYYDDNGSLIEEANDAGTLYTYTYNLLNRLASVENDTTVVNYKYDPDGVRVEKEIVGVDTVSYLIDPYNHTGYPQVLKQTDSASEISYIIGSSILAQAIGTNNLQYLVRDGHNSVRQIADPTGVILENYHFDAYGQLLPHSDSPSTDVLYVGQMWDNHLQRYNNWHRWYNPAMGRFNSIDPYHGTVLEPQSLHRYLYCYANPVNGNDPTGLVFWTPYHGIRVHNEIGYHFMQTSINDRLYNRRINTILKTKVEWWGWNRPDLVDRTTAEVYEIKPMGTYIAARAQLGWYLLLLNTYDPQHRIWKPGVTYMPPSMVKIDLMSFAFVHPPQNGVILYEPFDARPIVSFVIAYQLAKLEAHVAMIKVRTVALRVPF